MTTGTSGGSGTPENDDPFAYLYRQEGGGSATDEDVTAQQSQYGQPGVPRTSYNQVTRVGQTNYGQRTQAGGGYGHASQQTRVQPGAMPQVPDQGRPADGPSGRGAARRDVGGRDNGKGLLIGAVAVVLAVAVGIAVALSTGNGESQDAKGKSDTSEKVNSDDGTSKRSKPNKKPQGEMPSITDAVTLELSGGAKKATEHRGALADGGAYVDGMQAPGATVTWKVTVPLAGEYQYNVRYGNAGDDAKATLVVNGTTQSINLKNYGVKGDWSKAWSRSYGIVRLQKGDNIIDLTCGEGDQCAFNVDQIALTKSGYPQGW